jgi:hypothetical protein
MFCCSSEPETVIARLLRLHPQVPLLGGDRLDRRREAPVGAVAKPQVRGRGERVAVGAVRQMDA